MSAGELIIETVGLTKCYKDVTVLRDLNLQVPRGSIVGFLGANGSGKSTTIRLLLGLARPTSGHAAIFGLDSVRDSMAIRERVGYLAQEPRYYDHMTARETLRFAARFFFDGPASAIEVRITEMLQLVGLADRADRPIRGFSGGERQRLGIAQAQIHEPELLILDEPAAALDPMGRRDVLEVMAQLRDRATIFYSTHILDDVQRVSDRVAILSQGQLVAQASVEELLGAGHTVTYTLVLIGAVASVQARLAGLPWVTEVRVEPPRPEVSEVITLEVTASDPRVAAVELLPQVIEGRQVTVLSFGRKKSTLEQVFMELVEGAQRNGSHRSSKG